MTHLAGAREFRWCYEILQTRGKFTFIGLDAECILNHPDFAPLTNRTVHMAVAANRPKRQNCEDLLSVPREKTSAA